MPLFEVVILEMPTKKEMEEGKMERLVLGPIPVIAKNTEAAGFSIFKEKAAEIMNLDENRMAVQIRPFV